MNSIKLNKYIKWCVFELLNIHTQIDYLKDMKLDNNKYKNIQFGDIINKYDNFEQGIEELCKTIITNEKFIEINTYYENLQLELNNNKDDNKYDEFVY